MRAYKRGRWGRNTTRGRNITLTRPAAVAATQPHSRRYRRRHLPPGTLCGVSAVYGDHRRHLPSSLALPLRSASLGYERRDFLPDEDAIPDRRAAFSPRYPLLRPSDLGLMYKNKLVRRAFYFPLRVQRRRWRVRAYRYKDTDAKLRLLSRVLLIQRTVELNEWTAEHFKRTKCYANVVKLFIRF